MEVKVRKVLEADSYFLFNLRNQLYVYENSGTPESVEWLNHLDWLKKVFTLQSNRKLFIIEVNKEPAGQVRFDIQNNQATISISLLEKFHGQGIAKKAINMGMTVKELSNIKSFVAQTHQNNIASQKLFEKLGFKFRNKEGEWKNYEKTI